jgi:HSP20 family protein
MVYRTSLTPIVSLRREMDRLFEDAFGRATPSPASWTPAVDVRETKDAWVFELELPGVDPAAVDVTADQKVLRIRGEKTSLRPEGEEQRWLSVERVTGSFERSFRLPSAVREDAIEARYQHGLLTVTVPKAEVPQARKISVQH